MCFSPEASFSASGVLLVVGMASISKISRPDQFMFAATPLLFSIQQLSEGIIWLGLGDQKLATHIFVTFGQIVWPVWIPLANWFMEQEQKRKKLLSGFFIFGILLSCYLIYLVTTSKVSSDITQHHILYSFDYPLFVEKYSLLYLISTVASLLFSSEIKIKLMGVFTFIAFLMSKLYFEHFVFSVWCFFAAFLSIYIFFVIKSLGKDSNIIGKVIYD